MVVPRASWLAVLAVVMGCARPGAPPTEEHAPSVRTPPRPTEGGEAMEPRPPAPAATPQGAPKPAPAAAIKAPLGDRYPWLDDATIAVPRPADNVEERFAPPAGFLREELDPTSFGAWLRGLPLLPRGTSVLSHHGDLVLSSDHPNLAAVVAIDVGDRDLQQCADSVIRLHAEWRWSRGRRDHLYRAASGAQMPFARWAAGERPKPEGLSFTFQPARRPDASYASFRRYLDAVFTWANTGALARDAERVNAASLTAGDFVVVAGTPGHAVLVVDVARAPDGRRALLLAQGFMPAQSFHVLRPDNAPSRAPEAAWFIVEPGATSIKTPFWAPFSLEKNLRRLP